MRRIHTEPVEGQEEQEPNTNAKQKKDLKEYRFELCVKSVSLCERHRECFCV